MKISAINPTQNNQQKRQSFKGKFLYDELNLLPKQLKEVETIAKNFDISFDKVFNFKRQKLSFQQIINANRIFNPTLFVRAFNIFCFILNLPLIWL